MNGLQNLHHLVEKVLGDGLGEDCGIDVLKQIVADDLLVDD